MVGVLFWNTCITARTGTDIHRISQIEDAIVDSVIENDCDIIVLAEFNSQTAGLCNKLSLKGRDFRERKPIAGNPRIKILADNRFVNELIRDSKYYAIHDFTIAGYHFLLGGVHLPSKLHTTKEGIQIAGQIFIEAIKEAEKEAGHEKVIMIGDFNANPFETIMTDFSFLHAILDSSIVERVRSRQVYGKTNQIFYNPMWNLLGDNNHPIGSYYSDHGESCKLFWHIFDQVVMSADFIRAYKKDSLRILTGADHKYFLNQSGKPDKEHYSDHLPIYFSFQEDLL